MDEFDWGELQDAMQYISLLNTISIKSIDVVHYDREPNGHIEIDNNYMCDSIDSVMDAIDGYSVYYEIPIKVWVNSDMFTALVDLIRYYSKAMIDMYPEGCVYGRYINGKYINSNMDEYIDSGNPILMISEIDLDSHPFLKDDIIHYNEFSKKYFCKYSSYSSDLLKLSGSEIRYTISDKQYLAICMHKLFGV